MVQVHQENNPGLDHEWSVMQPINRNSSTARAKHRETWCSGEQTDLPSSGKGTQCQGRPGSTGSKDSGIWGGQLSCHLPRASVP